MDDQKKSMPTGCIVCIIIGVVVIVVVLLILFALSFLLPSLGKARGQANEAREMSQLRAIHSGISFWAPSHNGRYPIPGLEERLPLGNGLGYIKGRGPENLLVNDHASMLSMCIMQNLFTTETLISYYEPSDFVYQMEGYNYDAYDFSQLDQAGTGWDRLFVNDLSMGSNNSYGIMPITGKRKRQNWGVSTNNPSGFPIIGTRGPQDGVEDKYSKGNWFLGEADSWQGIVIYGDGHQEMLYTFYSTGTKYVSEDGLSMHDDNIFLEEQDQFVDQDYMPRGLSKGQGADAILTHIKFGDVNANGKGGGVNSGGFLHD